ncbi:DUF6685 family protein [Providencia rustigianii]|nr:DUF6685 family protein [Providencia rustigianii]
MKMRKLLNWCILKLYQTTEYHIIDKLNNFNLEKIELYKPAVDSYTFIRWDFNFDEYRIRKLPVDLKDILGKILITEESMDYVFDFNRIQSLTASKSFVESFERKKSSHHTDLYTWGKSMYPSDNMKAVTKDDWLKNIKHIENQGFNPVRPIRVNYYEWLDRYLGLNDGGSHHAALVVYQSIRDSFEYTREVKLKKLSFNKDYIQKLDNEYLSFMIINDDSNESESVSESLIFTNYIRSTISEKISIFIPLHYYLNLKIIFIPKKSLKIDFNIFNDWLIQTHNNKKIISFISYLKNPHKYHIKTYTHEPRSDNN